jgi:hypothetical protein
MTDKPLTPEEQLEILSLIESRLDEDIEVSETLLLLDDVKNLSPEIIERKRTIFRALEKKTKDISDYCMLADDWGKLDNSDEAEKLYRKCERLAKSVDELTTLANAMALDSSVCNNDQDKRIKSIYIRAIRRVQTEEEWARCAQFSGFMGGVAIM